jgi:hypothetical protein
MSQAGIINISDTPLPPDIPIQFTTDNGIAVPASNNLNVFGGTGTNTSASGSTITINVKSDGFTWSEQSSNFNAAIQNGYYCNAGLTVTLPATSGLVIGNTIIIYVDTTSIITIQANTGQMIQVGDTVSVSAGTATNSKKGDVIELNFKPSDSTWHTIDMIGTWTTT